MDSDTLLGVVEIMDWSSMCVFSVVAPSKGVKSSDEVSPVSVSFDELEVMLEAEAFEDSILSIVDAVDAEVEDETLVFPGGTNVLGLVAGVGNKNFDTFVGTLLILSSLDVLLAGFVGKMNSADVTSEL